MWTKEQDRASKRKWYLKNKERLRSYFAQKKRESYHKDIKKSRLENKLKHKKYRKKRNAYSRYYYQKIKSSSEYKKVRNERSLKHYYNNPLKSANPP